MRLKRTACLIVEPALRRRTTAGVRIATEGERISTSYSSSTSILSSAKRTTARSHEMILWGAVHGVKSSVRMGHLTFVWFLFSCCSPVPSGGVEPPYPCGRGFSDRRVCQFHHD